MGGRGSSSGMNGGNAYSKSIERGGGGRQFVRYSADGKDNAMSAIRNAALEESEHNRYNTDPEKDGPSVMKEYQAYHYTVNDTANGISVGGEVSHVKNVGGADYWTAESPYMDQVFPGEKQRPKKSNQYKKGYAYNTRAEAESALRKAVEAQYNAYYNRKNRG